MATNNSCNQVFSNDADGFTFGGWLVRRLLRLLGADVTMTGSGSAVITFPATTSQLSTLALAETLTNKTLTSPTIDSPNLNEAVALTATSTKLNYLSSATGTTGTNTTNVVFSTSPALTTPTVVTSIVGWATFAAFNTVTTALTFGGAATTMTIGGTPTTAITHNYSTNATANAVTKTVNLATGGASGSITNVNIGSANWGTTTVSSPNLSTGTSCVFSTGTIELGHASDTTISRVSAGVVAVEWVNLCKENRTITINGTAQDLSANRSWTVTASPSFWNAVPDSPTRTGNATFTVTDTSNANKYDLLLSRQTRIKWTESSVVKQAMIVSATYATDVVTVTIEWDTMASIDSNSLKYSTQRAKMQQFAYPGAVGSAVNNLANVITADCAWHVFGAIAYHINAGTTGATTYTISKNATDGTGTITAAALSVASAGTASADQTMTSGTTMAVGDKLYLNSTWWSTTNASEIYVHVFYAEDNDQYFT